MLLSPVPHRGSNIYKHTLFAGLKPWDASFFSNQGRLLFTGKRTTWLEFFCIILCLMFIFFFLCFFFPSSLFSCHFEFALRAWNQSQWEPGVYGSQQGWGDQTLFECHMWGWLNWGQAQMYTRTHQWTHARTFTHLEGGLWIVVSFCNLISTIQYFHYWSMVVIMRKAFRKYSTMY